MGDGRRRRRTVARTATLALCVLLGCNGWPGGLPMVTKCGAGQTAWRCTLKPTPCHMAIVVQACGVTEQDAIVDADTKATDLIKPRDPIQGTTCQDTGQPSYTGQSYMPGFRVPPHPPSPENTCVTSTDDNACTTCVKGSCCSDYQNCLNDAGCLCWVSCKASGYPDTTCEQTSYCGPLDPVASSAAACLDANCGAECGTMIAGTGGSNGCDTGGSTGSGGSTGGTTATCTGGAGMPGDPCANDEGCASCNCDMQTMTCY